MSTNTSTPTTDRSTVNFPASDRAKAGDVAIIGDSGQIKPIDYSEPLWEIEEDIFGVFAEDASDGCSNVEIAVRGWIIARAPRPIMEGGLSEPLEWSGDVKTATEKILISRLTE